MLDGAVGGATWPWSGLVFPSTCGRPLSGFSKIKLLWDREIVNALRSRGEGTAVAPWRLHDLRRAVATGMQARKVPREVVEAVLNHVSALRGTIVGVYQCYEYRHEKRAALRKWGRHIATITAA